MVGLLTSRHLMLRARRKLRMRMRTSVGALPLEMDEICRAVERVCAHVIELREKNGGIIHASAVPGW